MPSGPIDMFDKVELPLEPLSCGTITYIREDGRPLLKHHYEALSAFVCGAVKEAAGPPDVSEEMMAGEDDDGAEAEDLYDGLIKDFDGLRGDETGPRTTTYQGQVPDVLEVLLRARGT
ncbi:hypothetical protein SLS53_002793 [Cytospora paraplurivora]|uniref:Uncharacterized protein n=1 Tax=Cytospora paraplurivora TaxID=2898453 RepID=A0AAN9UCI7_9PEZI